MTFLLLTRSLDTALENIKNNFGALVQRAIEMSPNFIIALLIILGFHFLSKFIANKTTLILQRISDNLALIDLIGRLTRIIILAMGLFLALGILHLDKTVTSLIAGIGIIGLALSFAFQHVASDVLSGVIISMRKSISVGDLIESNGVFGNVIKIDVRTTRIMNVKGQIEEIPNRLVTDNVSKDYSLSGFRRIDINGRINFSEDLTALRQQVETEMSKFDFIYTPKQPNMVYKDLDFEKVTFALRVWMNFSNADGEFLNARSAILEKLSVIFREQGITMNSKIIQIHDK